MKAIVYKEYGSPQVLKIEEVQTPAPLQNEVLIQIHATSLNASDVEFLKGYPAYTRAWGLTRPRFNILGSDISGVVVSVGSQVTRFKTGDEVFCDVIESWGGFAEFICVKENILHKKPTTLSHEVMASLPQSATIALQCLKYKKQIAPGEKVLIIGAGGGTGSFAIQLAKLFGAHITAIDNTHKQEKMLSLGADVVIDYTQIDFKMSLEKYDRVLDFIGTDSIFNCNALLNKNGVYLVIGGNVPKLLQTLLMSPFISLFYKKTLTLLIHEKCKEINELIKLCELKKITPVIANTYSLKETPQAFQDFIDQKFVGKLVIKI